MSNRLLDREHSFLLIIDIQEKFLPVLDDIEHVIQNAGILIQAALQLDIPIVVSEQFPRGLGSTVETLRNLLPQHVKTFEKTSFSCLGDLRLTNYIKSLKRQQAIIAGIETHICVNQTTHHLLECGFEPHIIADAVTSRTQQNRDAGLRKMESSRAIISSTEIALFELLRGSSHPMFKDIQKLVK
ncbi:MAG: isochorismatase family protein [bacterium]|nr:isochorismatase family protein [bacterium]